MAKGLEQQELEEQPWRVLEFYSGIGGMVIENPIPQIHLFCFQFLLPVFEFFNAFCSSLHLSDDQRYSLLKAGVNAEVVEAFDINDTANDVYEHNFGHRPYQVLPSF